METGGLVRLDVTLEEELKVDLQVSGLCSESLIFSNKTEEWKGQGTLN